jgi:hypothetical protein
MKTRGWLAGCVVLAAAGCGVPWEKYSSPDGRFEIVMPGAPKLGSDNQETPQGVITFHPAVVDRAHASFVAAWADVPPKIPIDLGKRLDVLVGHYQGTNLQKHAIEKAGQPGLAFVMDTKKPVGQAAGQIFQIQNRLYQLLVVGSHVEGSSDSERFFDTFKLINPEMKPETTAHD